MTGLRARLSRLGRNQAELEAEELLDELSYAEISRISDCKPGDKLRVSGTVRTLTIRPRTAIPALEIELYDGSGSLRVLWLGRRRIDGPRWFLRAVFLGAAARPGNAAAALENVVRALVVVRGREAMAAGSAIPMRLPDAPVAPATVSVPVVDPFERGPEITEIR